MAKGWCGGVVVVNEWVGKSSLACLGGGEEIVGEGEDEGGREEEGGRKLGEGPK